MNNNKNDQLSKERIHKISDFLKGIELYTENKFTEESFKVINEALIHTSAGLSINYEKLEFLGDAVLRLVSTEFIEKEFPRMKVGERSSLRSQLVSDQWLANLGKQISIKDMLIMGTKAKGDHLALSTIEADSTEALIGAIFICIQDLKKIESWLSPFWLETSKIVLSDPHKLNPKSGLQEWSQGKGFEKPKYEIKELSQKHGDPRRFFCKVRINNKTIGEGHGGSIKEAEKKAANIALRRLLNST